MPKKWGFYSGGFNTQFECWKTLSYACGDLRGQKTWSKNMVKNVVKKRGHFSSIVIRDLSPGGGVSKGPLRVPNLRSFCFISPELFFVFQNQTTGVTFFEKKNLIWRTGGSVGRTFIFLFCLFLENYLIYHANYFWSP